MRSFWLALQFLTRLPTPTITEPQPQELGRSLLHYPLVGLVIGALLWAMAVLLGETEPLLRAALLLSFWVGVTGALHLDGLADTADAWVGGQGDAERMLAIMKDPCSGPVGVTAVVLLLALKLAALQVIVQHELWGALFMAPALARAAVPLLFATTPYVRAQGLATALIERLPRTLLKHMVLLMLVLVLLLQGWQGLVLVAVVGGTVFLLRQFFMRAIGGVTGDTVGAKVELAELSALLFFAL